MESHDIYTAVHLVDDLLTKHGYNVSMHTIAQKFTCALHPIHVRYERTGCTCCDPTLTVHIPETQGADQGSDAAILVGTIEKVIDELGPEFLHYTGKAVLEDIVTEIQDELGIPCYVEETRTQEDESFYTIELMDRFCAF
jgi:hypothetical protein